MGFFSAIYERMAAARQRSKDKKEFFDGLIKAAEDGKLTDTEMNAIQVRYKQLGLTRDDLKGIRAQAYSAALRAVKTNGVVTAEGEAELLKVEQFLIIPNAEIATPKRELARLRILGEIKNGTPRAVSVENVILQRGETPYWSEPGSLLEERVVAKHYEGGSQGLSFRIARGVSYRVGSHRGHLVTDKAILPVSSGDLIITSRRVIFRGDAKSFSIALDKLLDLRLYSDAIRLTDDKGKPRTVKFVRDGNADIVGASLSFAINHFAKQDL
jgi:hypothetical protein